MIVQKIRLVYNGSKYVTVYDWPDFTPGDRMAGGAVLAGHGFPRKARL